MKLLPGLLLFLVCAAIGHIAYVVAAPHLIMHVAMDHASERGAKINSLLHAPRTTEASRRIVRPAPDLAYSLCVFDVSKGPVIIAAAPSALSYTSVSLYGPNTDNFAVFAVDPQTPDAQVGVVIYRPRATGPAAMPDGLARMNAPGDRGIALIRRLAPTPEAFATAQAAQAGDVCALFKPPA